MKWHAIAPGRTYEDGGELLVYYCQGSGSTHLISQVAAFILDRLQGGPLSTDELVRLLLEQVDDVPEAELRESLQALLTELQGSELVEAA